jgi:hypothetical protein
MIVCLFMTAALIVFLEPGMRPPGFTGRGAYAMVLIFLGAFYLAGICRHAWVFLLFGGLGALLLLLPYVRDDFEMGYASRRAAVIGWTIFVLAIAFLTRMFAKVRWRLILEIPRESPLCMYCGYDLRASQTVCSECGNAFDVHDATTYLATARRWDLRWLARRTTIVLLSVTIPSLISYGWLYFRSQMPAIGTVERLGGQISGNNDLTSEFSWLPSAIPTGPFEGLFQHVDCVMWRNQAIQDDQLVCLKEFTQLHEIHIDNAPITGRGFSQLANLNHLELLYTPGSAINDAGLAGIETLRGLTQLQLSGTAITDAGLDHLKLLRNMEALWLDQTAVSDVGLNKLADLPRLYFLDLTKTNATTDGIRRFKKLRPSVSVNGP